MISVALATCQGERWIQAQVASILEQLGPHDELVVADASSTDRTLEIVRDHAGDRARILEGLPRGDIPRTFETALRACRGELLFLSDQDDVWLPGKVERCTQALHAGRPMTVLHDARVVDADGRVLSESFLRARKRRDGFWHNIWRPSYLGCALAFRRELLDLALPFPGNLPMHDWWIGLLSERTGNLSILEAPLLLHRRHDSNASYGADRSGNPLSTRLLLRWRIWREIRLRLDGKA